MVREDIINSAVSFLQDPSVANAPLDKRIAFLQSKNLTQEEIDVSLARAGGAPGAISSASSSPAPSNYGYPQQSSPPGPYGGQYQGYWQPPPPPPEVPQRDWRDWFIMATVLGGVGYGLYFTAKRYIVPLIAPPTTPQLEQDKASIDQQFERAFALLEQLETDTKALKASEETRTERLDAALTEMETVIASLKDSSRRRDDDSRRIEDDVRGLRDLIPKALDAHKESTAGQLKDLGSELKSLKTLVANRMGTGAAAPARPNTTGLYGGMTGAPNTNGTTTAVPATTTASEPVTPAEPAAVNATVAAPSTSTTANITPATIDGAATSNNSSFSPYSRLTNGRASIPAWQMAAQKKSQEESSEKKDTSESGTITEATA